MSSCLQRGAAARIDLELRFLDLLLRLLIVSVISLLFFKLELDNLDLSRRLRFGALL